MSTLEGVLIFLLIALLPVQDSVLQRTPVRGLGASLSVIPLCLLLLLRVARALLCFDLSMPRALFRAYGYACCLTLLYLCLWGFSFQESSLAVKSLNELALVTLYLFAAFGTRYTANRWMWAGAMTGFALSILCLLLGPLLDSSSLLHATANLDARPRGLCTESSTFSVQVVITGLLATFVARRRVLRVLLLSTTTGLLVLSGSKGGLLSLLFCSAVFGAVRAGLRPARVLLGALVLVPMGSFVAGLISQGFENDLISNGSSIATRGTMAVFAVLCALHNPFGVGFSGFYPAMARYLPDAMRIMASFVQFPLIFMEVSDYQYTMENADCKTWFLDFLVYFGLPFAIAFTCFFFRLLRRLHREQEPILFIGALFSCLALLTYYSSINTYSVPVLIGVCLSAHRHENSALRLRA